MFQHPFRAVSGRAAVVQGLQLLESCSFRWIFDDTTHRFRRTPRDARVWLECPEDWAEYHHLKIDESRSCFAVALDEGGTRILRAWLHHDPCQRCGRGDRSTGDLQLRTNSGRPRRAHGGWLRPEAAR